MTAAMIIAESVAFGMYLNQGVRNDAARRTIIPVKNPEKKVQSFDKVTSYLRQSEAKIVVFRLKSDQSKRASETSLPRFLAYLFVYM